MDTDLHDDISRLAKRAEAAGTRVYGLHLDSPVIDAQATGNVALTHDLDDHLGFDAMSQVAVATGGTAFRVVGSIIPRLVQIDEESSGYYVLAVDVDSSERGDRPLDLEVRARRAGLEVRARRVFTAPIVAKPPAPISHDDASITTARMLQSPLSLSDISLDVDTVASVGIASAKTTRYVVVVDLGVEPDLIAAIGFHLTTPDGRTVAYKIESPAVVSPRGSGASYLVALDLEPGPYRLRLACLGTQGARGSLERLFVVDGPPRGPDISEIFLGRDNTIPWQPIATLDPGQRRLGVRVELRPGPSTDAQTVRLAIGRVGQPTWISQADLSITGDSRTDVASGAVNTAQLSKGWYVLMVERIVNGARTSFTAKIFQVR